MFETMWANWAGAFSLATTPDPAATTSDPAITTTQYPTTTSSGPTQARRRHLPSEGPGVPQEALHSDPGRGRVAGGEGRYAAGVGDGLHMTPVFPVKPQCIPQPG